MFDAPIVHLGGTGLLKTLDGPPSERILAEAKRRGCTTTFDLIAASAETAHLVLPLLPHIDYFMPSIEEAQDMSGRRGPEDCASFYLDRGAAARLFIFHARHDLQQWPSCSIGQWKENPTAHYATAQRCAVDVCARPAGQSCSQCNARPWRLPMEPPADSKIPPIRCYVIRIQRE